MDLKMKQKNGNKQILTDTDLQLYLAGVLPWNKSFLFRILLIFNRELRQRAQQARKANQQFYQQEFPRLKSKVIGVEQNLAEIRLPASTETESALKQPFKFSGAWKLAAGLAFVLALGFGLTIFFQMKEDYSQPVQYAAKGKSLGVHLYITGIRAQRVEHYSIQLSENDTLQVIPVGSEKQFLFIYGWEFGKGLIRLFPETGTTGGAVSKDSLPPSLVLDKADNLKLVCVSSPKSLEAEKIRTLLSGKPFVPIQDAPSALLEKDIYVQIYSLNELKP
jgi:hypothetical protein